MSQDPERNKLIDPLLRAAVDRAPSLGAPSLGRPKRRHPARGARLSALAMSCAATAGLTYWFADLNATQAAKQTIDGLPVARPITSTTTPAATAVAPTATAVLPVPTVGTTSAVETVAPTTVVDTTVSAIATQAFNGQVVDTRYGPVQVQVQITGGAVSEVAVVQFPDSDGKSVRINARALPKLRTEALAAQSARVDSISGATYTSHGYVRSLQSAIDAARSAGVTSLV